MNRPGVVDQDVDRPERRLGVRRSGRRPTLGSLRSAVTAAARRPSAWICATVSVGIATSRSWHTTSAPASASARAMPWPSPVDEPVTSAIRPSSLKASRMLICVRPPARSWPREVGVHVHHPEQAVLHLAVRRHHPQEADRVPRDRHVRVVALRHQHDVAVAHEFHALGLVLVGVDHLQREGLRRHVEVDVQLLGNGLVLVRRPAGPVAGLRPGDAGHQATGLHVLADQDVQVTPRVVAARLEAQARVGGHLGVRDVAQRVRAGDRRPALGDVDAAVRANRRSGDRAARRGCRSVRARTWCR